MTRPTICRAAALLIGVIALAGCGNQQEAEVRLMLTATAKQPAFLQAMTRLELASVFAGLELTREEADALRAWAAEHGAAVRAELDAAMAEVSNMAPDISATAKEYIATRAGTLAAQEAIGERILAEQRAAIAGDEPPIDVGELVGAEVDSLLPLAAGFDDRRQLVMLGGWGQTVEAIGELLVLKEQDTAEEKQQAIISAVMQARGMGWMPDEELQKKLQGLVAEIPTGQDGKDGAEEHALKLFEAAPPADAADQLHNATVALATLLCEEPAAELLALVP